MPAEPRTGHTTNFVGIPTAVLASADFNRYPVPLHIHGTREANRGLFEQLNTADNIATAGTVFQDYMSVIFGYEDEQRFGIDAEGRRRFRSSYLKLLQDWGFDSNNPQGAVLKGWVESRFGLFPTFHKAPLTGFTTEAWAIYITEKMSSRYHNNCIFLQLDLLYEFCQWAIQRFHPATSQHLTLYRGVDSLANYPTLAPGHSAPFVVRMNNVASFTSQREIAERFGAHVLEIRVPAVKLLFFNELIPRHALRGEAEYLAIGGDYWVRLAW